MSETQNRALDRGISVLEALSLSSGLSLAGLHRQTGIPKSSLRRALATLIARRFVRRSVGDGKYRSNVQIPINTSALVIPGVSEIPELAMPHLLELTKIALWPSDLHLLADKYSLIIDSTRFASPFDFQNVPLDRKLNFFGSAAGIACMAAMKPQEVEKFHAHTLDDDLWGLSRFGLTLESYQARLDETRRAGYGIRIMNFLGENVVDDQLSAIAVPVLRADKPIGAISIIWSRPYATTADFAVKHLGNLKATAKQISDTQS